jgi:hypothetical protein
MKILHFLCFVTLLTHFSKRKLNYAFIIANTILKRSDTLSILIEKSFLWLYLIFSILRSYFNHILSHSKQYCDNYKNWPLNVQPFIHLFNNIMLINWKVNNSLRQLQESCRRLYDYLFLIKNCHSTDLTFYWK